MTTSAQLVEQHIIEYESHLKHIDELLERAIEKMPPGQPELKELTAKREELVDHIEAMRLKNLEDWREKEMEMAGPMGIWDAVAQQLEELIERFGK
jgi:hypothetical protein